MKKQKQKKQKQQTYHFDIREKSRIFADRERQFTEPLFNNESASRAVEYFVDNNY